LHLTTCCLRLMWPWQSFPRRISRRRDQRTQFQIQRQVGIVTVGCYYQRSMEHFDVAVKLWRCQVRLWGAIPGTLAEIFRGFPHAHKTPADWTSTEYFQLSFEIHTYSISVTSSDILIKQQNKPW
jgi:hypothetical protein